MALARSMTATSYFSSQCLTTDISAKACTTGPSVLLRKKELKCASIYAGCTQDMVVKWITQVIQQYDSSALAAVAQLKIDPIILCSLAKRLATRIPFSLI